MTTLKFAYPLFGDLGGQHGVSAHPNYEIQGGQTQCLALKRQIF